MFKEIFKECCDIEAAARWRKKNFLILFLLIQDQIDLVNELLLASLLLKLVKNYTPFIWYRI